MELMTFTMKNHGMQNSWISGSPKLHYLKKLLSCLIIYRKNGKHTLGSIANRDSSSNMRKRAKTSLHLEERAMPPQPHSPPASTVSSLTRVVSSLASPANSITSTASSLTNTANSLTNVTLQLRVSRNAAYLREPGTLAP